MEISGNSLLLLVSAGLVVAQTPTPVTLVNPGFEAPYNTVNLNGGKTTGQVANGWLDDSSFDNATVQYSQETTNPHGGASCQKIVVANARMLLYQALQLRAGNIYTASVWMRGLPGTVVSLAVQKNSSVYFENDVALTSAWQQVSTQGYITTTETGALTIQANGPATFWVDDAAVSYTPGTFGPTPNLGPIAPTFFGMHVQRFNNSRFWNGGFEPPYYQVGVHNKVSGDVAANWLVYSGNSDVTAAYSEDTDNPHSGISSQKISVSLVNSGNIQLLELLSLLPGATYTMTAWLRGDPATKVFMALYEGSSNTSYASTGVSLTSNWKQVSITGQVTGAGLVNAIIGVQSPGTVWVDDVSVTDASGQPVSGGAPWPAAGLGTLRLWYGQQGTTWAELEPVKGVWNWGPLDNLVEAAEEHGVSDILLTLGQSPGWASSSPDTVGGVGFFGQPAGATAPPADIQDWRDYVTAVAQRYKGRIRYYEIWNEPNLPAYYTGTVAQLVTLTQEAYKILKAVDPGNTIVSPAVATAGWGYLDQLLAAGMGNYVDLFAYHVYTHPEPPESAGRDLANVRLVMAKYGLAKMPLWDTEGASGDNTTPPDLAAKYIARHYLTVLAFGSVRHYWYAWDQAGPFWVGTVENDRRVLTPAGRAYGFLYGWLVGSSLTQALIDAAGNWQIWLTRPDGTQALVVWNPSQTTQLTLPGTFTARSSHDLAGGVHSISGTTVTVTDSPVLLTSSVDAPPAISSVNVAGGEPDLAQNTWIEIRGKNLAPANTPASGMIWSAAPEFASNLMPTQLGNLPLQVTVNNIPAYLYFFCSAATSSTCASDQINVLTPLDSTTGPVQIVVYNGIYSASFTVNLRAAAPSFPLVGATKYLVATHADYSLVGPASMSVPGYPFTPAQPGETILIYAFGFGLPKSAIVSGSASQAGSLPTPPVCQIGGTAATVAFAGVIGPGLYQLNVVVPRTASSGDNLIMCSYNGASSPAGDLIAVQ